MAKYEIMLLVDGNLDEKNAKEAIKELTSIIDDSKNFKMTELGLKTLAYKINTLDKSWYFQFNFDLVNVEKIAEFRRVASINKSIVRNLIINLEKEYGARAKENEKKVKRSEVKKTKFQQRQTRMAAEWEAREKAQQEYKNISSLAKETKKDE